MKGIKIKNFFLFFFFFFKEFLCESKINKLNSWKKITTNDVRIGSNVLKVKRAWVGQLGVGWLGYASPPPPPQPTLLLLIWFEKHSKTPKTKKRRGIKKIYTILDSDMWGENKVRWGGRNSGDLKLLVGRGRKIINHPNWNGGNQMTFLWK